MRAWCNCIKRAVIDDGYDRHRPQTYKVVQSEKSPVDNATTWLKWWAGDVIPRPSHIQAAERLVPGSSRLLNLSEVGTPPLRHLVALDILNTRFRTNGRPSDYQRAQIQRLLTALNNAWAPFLDTRPTAPTNRFALETQLGGVREAELQYDVRGTAHELEWILDGGNLRRVALPRKALEEHNWLEPMSIFRFLGSLAAFNELDNPALLKMWAYDYASAAMIMRTQLELAGKKEMPVLRMGRAGIIFSLAVNTFWAPPHLRLESKVLTLIRILEPDHVKLVRERLLAARSSYYHGFATWGILERTMRALNADHKHKTWDAAFSIPRTRI